MGTTWFKRLENRSRSTVTLLNKEDSNSRGHNIAVPSKTHIALDMKIPWAPFSGDFPSKHLELQKDGVTRYWIWQSTHADGDFIRYSTDSAWHNQGEHVYGYAGSATNFLEAFGTIGATYEDWAQYVLTDRVLVVLDSHFETIPIKPKPFGPAHTFIKRLQNHTTVSVTLFSTLSKQSISVGPGATVSLDMEVPWALSATGFFPFLTTTSRFHSMASDAFGFGSTTTPMTATTFAFRRTEPGALLIIASKGLQKPASAQATWFSQPVARLSSQTQALSSCHIRWFSSSSATR